MICLQYVLHSSTVVPATRTLYVPGTYVEHFRISYE